MVMIILRNMIFKMKNKNNKLINMKRIKMNKMKNLNIMKTMKKIKTRNQIKTI